MERGDDTASAACTSTSGTVFVMTPPNEHTSEGGRDDRGVPRTMRNRPLYPVLKCSSPPEPERKSHWSHYPGRARRREWRSVLISSPSSGSGERGQDSKVWRESAEVVTTMYTSAVLANWRRAELTKRCRAVCHHDANSPNVWGSAALASRIASSSRASAPTAAGSVESYKFMVSFRYVFWSS